MRWLIPLFNATFKYAMCVYIKHPNPPDLGTTLCGTIDILVVKLKVYKEEHALWK